MIIFVWAILLVFLVIFVVMMVASGVISILKGFFDVFFGKGSNSSRREGGAKIHQPKSNKKKIIDKSEGEYVDFEEIE